MPVAPVPTYRAEVPLFAALPAQLRQAGLDMLGNLHQRMGDNDLRSRYVGAYGTYADASGFYADAVILGAKVQQATDNGWLARVGVRIQGEFATGAGALQPYARLNVYRASSGEDVARFVGPAASTDIVTRTGGTSTEIAAGATLQLSAATSVYGEPGKLYAAGGEERIGSGAQGSVGLRVRW